MRRRVFLFALALIAGVVINVLVAWAIAMWGAQTPWAFSPSDMHASSWPDLAPEGWPPPSAGVQWHWWYATIDRASASDVTGTPPRPGKFGFGGFVHVTSIGVPMRTLRCSLVGRSGSGVAFANELSPDSIWYRGIGGPHGFRATARGVPRRLPLRPIWPGFAVNSAFYGGLAWSATAGLIALRRWRRLRSGCCVHCGYRLAGLPSGAPCPECGKAP